MNTWLTHAKLAVIINMTATRSKTEGNGALFVVNELADAPVERALTGARLWRKPGNVRANVRAPTVLTTKATGFQAFGDGCLQDTSFAIGKLPTAVPGRKFQGPLA